MSVDFFLPLYFLWLSLCKFFFRQIGSCFKIFYIALQGAINLLLAVYKKEFRAMGGYLTDSSKVLNHFVLKVTASSKA